MKTRVSLFFTGLLSAIVWTTYAQSDVVLWKFQTGGVIYATPVIHDSVLYVGSLDSVFYAVNAKTGEQIWSYATDNKIYTTAAIYKDLICFKSGNVLMGLDLQGALQWTDTLYHGNVLDQHDEWDCFHSSPRLADSIAYIGSEKGLVYGVNIKTGTKVFKCQTPLASHTIETTPAIYNGKIYVGDWDGVFYAFNLSDSTLAWQYDTKDDNTYSWVNHIQTNPVIYNNAVYFAGRSCNLYSLDPETGTRNWMYHDPGNMWLMGGPAIADSVLYLGSSNQCVVRAFNVKTGDLKWQSGLDYRIFGTPLVDGDYIFVGTGYEIHNEYGSLIAIDKESGGKIELVSAGGQVHSSPVSNDSVIFVGSADGNIYAIHKNNLLSTQRPGTYIEAEDTVYLGELPNEGTYDTVIYVYNNGEITDSITTSASKPQVTVNPEVFDLAPEDSQAISITINLADLPPKSYYYNLFVFIKSNRSAFGYRLMKCFNVRILGPSGILNDNKEENRFSLTQNYPNPFEHATNIDYSVGKKCPVDLKVFDLMGRETAVLVNEVKTQGHYTVSFNASGLTDGVYFYKLNAGGNSYTGIMLKK